MDLNHNMFHTFPGLSPLPFYMDYPGYQGGKREEEIIRDMEYLQEVYPLQVKRFQRRIAQILDKADYEGSMIYDEYPDFTGMRSMADSIVRILQNEDAQLQKEEQIPAAQWEWIKDMIQVLLCDEIYKRRHGGRRGKIFWMS